MTYTPLNLQTKFGLFSDQWSPRIIARLNDYHIKLVKLEGEFIWHSHLETDELFMVIEGDMDIQFRDGKVSLKAGEMYVVPKGVEHRPFSVGECKVLLIEPAGTINTGDSGGARTARDGVWI